VTGYWRTRGWYHRVVPIAVALLLLLVAPPASAPPNAVETRVRLDAKDADVKSVVSLLSEAGGFQTVFDPDVSCRLTLVLNESLLQPALEAVLHACGLELEASGKVLRVARSGQLQKEAADERALREQRERRPHEALTLHRLDYARAAELVPLLKALLPPGSQITLDARTNTLIVLD
jgi:type II secretory pathway component GspD/PulD (secretin)